MTATLAPAPPEGTLLPSDGNVLARYWHPVAFSRDVAPGPLATRLLDVDLVVYRTADTAVGDAADARPYRRRRARLPLPRLALRSRQIVERQRPERLPLDLRDELHVRADVMAVAYRKALTELGLGTRFTS